MGQRHQIFVKVNNPAKAEHAKYFSKEVKKEFKKLFGAGKYSVIALHHQWLYGRSVAFNILNVMEMTDKEIMNDYNNPFSNNGLLQINSLKQYVDTMMMFFQIQKNILHPRGIGFERMIFLNEECFDEQGKYVENSDITKFFDIGDNNDGITIIDTIERKYCVMNIYKQEKNSNSVYELEQFKPVSALEYMNAYYKSKDEVKENKEIAELIKDYSILTKKEIEKIFPKMKGKF